MNNFEIFRHMMGAGLTAPLTVTSHSAYVTVVPRETGVSCGWIKILKTSPAGKK